MKLYLADTEEQIKLNREPSLNANYYILGYYEINSILHTNDDREYIYIIQNIEQSNCKLLSESEDQNDSNEVGLNLKRNYRIYPILKEEAYKILLDTKFR